jgi:hypothetical protein
VSGINSIVLDTNIVLYLLSGNVELSDILENTKAYVSVITEIELLGYKNISKKDRNTIVDFLKDCNVIQINEQIKNITIDLKIKNSIKTPDAIIAATSIYLDIPLITADKKFGNYKQLNSIIFKID